MASSTSAQISYANQPGYNDCLPSVFSSAKSSTASLSIKVKPDTTIVPPPTSSSSSLSLGSTEPSSIEIEENAERSSATATPERASLLLANVLSFKSKLPEREFNHYKTRLQQVVPTLSSQHLDVVHDCFECVLNKPSTETQQQARQAIIDHMMAHNGVSAWATPLRKVVESMVL